MCLSTVANISYKTLKESNQVVGQVSHINKLKLLRNDAEDDLHTPSLALPTPENS